MGDWNAKIGSEEINYRNIGERVGGNTNERGHKLAQWINKNNLKLTSSFFKKKDGRKWT